MKNQKFTASIEINGHINTGNHEHYATISLFSSRREVVVKYKIFSKELSSQKI
jgi:hypothetical protein